MSELDVHPMKEPTRTYRLAMAVSRPLAIWGRLRVEGVDALPPGGAVLVVGNHDSYWDPVMIGLAASGRRQIRALAKSTLWNVPGLAQILNGMGQIPIERGAGDAGALSRAVSELRAGACVGVFPEGTTSRGNRLRARSGVGRLAADVPEATIVLVAIQGATDITRFPHRPLISCRFFEPRGGQAQPDEDPGALSSRLIDELRELVPPIAAGRAGVR